MKELEIKEKEKEISDLKEKEIKRDKDHKEHKDHKDHNKDNNKENNKENKDKSGSYLSADSSHSHLRHKKSASMSSISDEDDEENGDVVWTLQTGAQEDEEEIGEKTIERQRERKESNALLRDLQSLQKSQIKATILLKKNLENAQNELDGLAQKDQLQMQRSHTRELEKMKERQKGDMQNLLKKQKKDFGNFETDLKKDHKQARNDFEEKVKKIISEKDKNLKLALKDFSGGKQESSTLKRATKDNMENWQNDVYKAFEQIQDAIGKDARYQQEVQDLILINQVKEKAIDEEHGLRLKNFEELASKILLQVEKENDDALSHHLLLQKNNMDQSSKTQKLVFEHMMRDQKEEEEALNLLIKSEEKNLPKKIKLIQVQSKRDLDETLSRKKKEALDDAKKNVATIPNKQQQKEAFDLERKKFEEFVRKEKEKFAIKEQQDIDAETKKIETRHRNLLELMKKRHQEAVDIKKIQQEAAKKNVTDLAKIKTEELNVKNDDRMERHKREQGNHKKDLLNTFQKEKAELLSQNNADTKDLENRYQRVSKPEQDVLVQKLDALLLQQQSQ